MTELPLRAAVRRIVRRVTLGAVVALAGCAASTRVTDESRSLLAAGQIEQGLATLERALEKDPRNREILLYYRQQRELSITGLLLAGDVALQAGNYDEAERNYRRVLLLSPGEARAVARLRTMDERVRTADLLAQAQAALDKGESAVAESRLREALALDPQSEAALRFQRKLLDTTRRMAADVRASEALSRQITIEFRDAPLKQVFEVISRTSGLNFVFDKDIRSDQRVTVFIRKTTVRDAINQLLITNQLEQRVLDANSILIFPNTPAKARDYQSLVIRSFYLINADAKAVANALRGIIKTRDIVADDKLNMIIVRDTAEGVRLAERIVAMHDVAQPEVMLEVEVLEVSRTRLLELGIQWPDRIALAPIPGPSGVLTLEQLRSLTSSEISAVIPPLTAAIAQQNGDAGLLANPRIRAKNREKASILIGERVPNITTTSTATGFVSDSVQYIDVGLKLDVEPVVQPNGEVTIRMRLEVSNIINQITTRSGTVAYQIGTRTATTTLKLKDGENQVLAGLIQDIDRTTASGIAGLTSLPLLGRLFSKSNDEKRKTEIVLSITPRVLRNLPRTELIFTEMDAGTESSFRTITAAAVAPPAALPAGSAARPTTTPAQPAAATTGAGAESGRPAPAGAQPAPGSETPSTPGAAAPQPAAAATGGPVASAAAGATALRFRGPASVKVGETFVVSMQVQPGEPITSLPVVVAFNPAQVQVVAANEGDALRQGGAPASFTSRVDAGQVLMTATRPGGTEGATQPGTVFSLGVRALAPGEISLRVTSASAIGNNGRAVQVAPVEAFRAQAGP